MKKCEELSEILKVLGNPVRLKILKHISGIECCVSEIENKLNLPQSTVSQHLAILKRMGIVKAERQHKEVNYILVDSFVKELLEICCKYS